MELITSTEEIAANLAIFNTYRTSKSANHLSYYSDRLRLGKIFVHGTVAGQHLFAPSRFAGYSQCTLEKHEAFSYKDGKVTTPAISKYLGKPTPNEEAEAAYRALCKDIGVDPSEKSRTYWTIELPDTLLSANVPAGESGFPDEVERYVEGATKRVLVNAYERNDKARSACLAHHGYNCSVCNFNFRENFGKKLGEKFMHVHHVKPISDQGGAYIIDPLNDLKPVCPNCHAMLHRSDPPFSIDELKEIRNAT